MNNDYNIYKKEHDKYRKLTSSLYYYQKYKDNPWINGENFGDYLSKIVVGEIALKNSLIKMKPIAQKLLAIGSIIHFAENNDIVWGAGINGKISLSRLDFNILDARAVRGPLTREILQKKKVAHPEIFGDPALLLPIVFPDLNYQPRKNKITCIPNLNEYKECTKIVPKPFNLVSPLLHWRRVIEEILTSEIVLTSSLHGLIISESFGVPVRLFKPFGGETLFKYEDYLEGTGRKLNKKPKSFNESFHEKDGVAFDLMKFNNEALIKAFPVDIFE